MASTTRKQRKSPPPLAVVNAEEYKPSTVEEFIDFFFKKMTEKLDKPTIIGELKEQCLFVYKNLIDNKNKDCGYYCTKCSECGFNKECSAQDKLLKINEIPVSNEFEIFGNAAEKGKDNTFISLINGNTVCKINNKVVKKTRFSANIVPSWNYSLTLFILILEIVIQNYVATIIKTDDYLNTNATAPVISDYYLHELSDDKYEVTMIMEYIETVPLEYSNYMRCIELLEYLQTEYSIFHNDTHADNIRQTKEGKIVLIDWGKGGLTKANPSSSGLYKDMTVEGFSNWLNASKLLEEGKYFRENDNSIYGGKIKKTKKSKKKSKKSKKKSKKSKKKTKKDNKKDNTPRKTLKK